MSFGGGGGGRVSDLSLAVTGGQMREIFGEFPMGIIPKDVRRYMAGKKKGGTAASATTKIIDNNGRAKMVADAIPGTPSDIDPKMKKRVGTYLRYMYGSIP